MPNQALKQTYMLSLRGGMAAAYSNNGFSRHR